MENGDDFYVCQGRWVDVPHTNAFIEAWRRDQHLTAQQVHDALPKVAQWMEAHIGYMQGSQSGATYEFRGGILFHPTHWMPLPKAPTSRKAWMSARKIAGQH